MIDVSMIDVILLTLYQENKIGFGNNFNMSNSFFYFVLFVLIGTPNIYVVTKLTMQL